jgi:hypothetical protein
MTKGTILFAGLIAAAGLTTPVLAQEATQEPGVMGFNYPNTRYLTGGYGARFTPGPRYYYRNQYQPYPRVGAFATAPWDDSYASYGGPYPARPRVGAFATAPWDNGTAYDGEPSVNWVAP